MIYTITTQNGNLWKTTSRDIKRAAWEYIEDTAQRRITTRSEIFGDHGQYEFDDRLDIDITGDGDWSGYQTESLRVRDGDGKTVTIPFSAVIIWSDNDRSQMFAFAGHGEATVTRGHYEETIEAGDILHEAGLCAVQPGVNYEWLAEQFLGTLPTARFYVDDERGFGNEWTLYIDTDMEDEEKDILRRITPEEAIRYIADSVMPRDEYVLIHGCEPFVAAYLR